MPGGCDFGVRPIDQHIKGFNIMGADVQIVSGDIIATTQAPLHAAGSIWMWFPWVLP